MDVNNRQRRHLFNLGPLRSSSLSSTNFAFLVAPFTRLAIDIIHSFPLYAFVSCATVHDLASLPAIEYRFEHEGNSDDATLTLSRGEDEESEANAHTTPYRRQTAISTHSPPPQRRPIQQGLS